MLCRSQEQQTEEKQIVKKQVLLDKGEKLQRKLFKGDKKGESEKLLGKRSAFFL